MAFGLQWEGGRDGMSEQKAGGSIDDQVPQTTYDIQIDEGVLVKEGAEYDGREVAQPVGGTESNRQSRARIPSARGMGDVEDMGRFIQSDPRTDIHEPGDPEPDNPILIPKQAAGQGTKNAI